MSISQFIGKDVRDVSEAFHSLSEEEVTRMQEEVLQMDSLSKCRFARLLVCPRRCDSTDASFGIDGSCAYRLLFEIPEDECCPQEFVFFLEVRRDVHSFVHGIK